MKIYINKYSHSHAIVSFCERSLKCVRKKLPLFAFGVFCFISMFACRVSSLLASILGVSLSIIFLSSVQFSFNSQAHLVFPVLLLRVAMYERVCEYICCPLNFSFVMHRDRRFFLSPTKTKRSLPILIIISVQCKRDMWKAAGNRKPRLHLSSSPISASFSLADVVFASLFLSLSISLTLQSF